jgi:uncharacterized protein
MLFALIRHDKPGCIGLRKSARPKHLEYLTGVTGSIKWGGAIMHDDGYQTGSILFVEAADQEAAEALAAADPYVEAGLFARTEIVPFRTVFADGVRID